MLDFFMLNMTVHKLTPWFQKVNISTGLWHYEMVRRSCARHGFNRRWYQKLCNFGQLWTVTSYYEASYTSHFHACPLFAVEVMSATFRRLALSPSSGETWTRFVRPVLRMDVVSLSRPVV